MKPLRHSDMARPDRVLMGAIIGAHGVRGHVRVKSFAAEPKDIASYGPLEDAQGRAYKLMLKGGADDVLIASLDGVTDRDMAEKLKGTELFVSRAALPAAGDEEFYHADLVGLDVRLQDGSRFGMVRAVHDFGAGDTLRNRARGWRRHGALHQGGRAGGRCRRGLYRARSRRRDCWASHDASGPRPC